MQSFSKQRREITPWSAIGEFLNGMRMGEASDESVLDHIGAANPAIAPRSAPPLFNCRAKKVGAPAQLFPHAQRLNAAKAAADPAVSGWLDMLERLRPFNIKGRIAGIHRYLANTDDLGAIARVVRSLSWTGPVVRTHRDDQSGDAALARYVSLRHLGIHTERLRLVWLSDSSGSADWIVTAILVDGQWLILDQYYGDVVGDDAYLDALPYFSLNAEVCRLHWRPGDPAGAEGALRLLGGQLKFGRA